jgi:hypothetical protein
VDDPEGLIPERIVAQLGPNLAQAMTEAVELRAMTRRLAARRLEFVVHGRMAGLSWDSVGWLLGITGQGARQQYAAAVSDIESELGV